MILLSWGGSDMILKPSSCIGCPLYQHGAYYTPDHIVDDSEVMFIAQNPGVDEEAGHKLIKRHHYGSQYSDEFTQVEPQPLIGETGQLFDKRFLPLTGLYREQVSVGNAIRCRPGTSLNLNPNDLPSISNKMHLERSDALIVKALKHCKDAHLHIPPSVKLVVTMGSHALFQLTGVHNVSEWRGYALDHRFVNSHTTMDTSYYHDLFIPTYGEGYRTYVTMHIAALFKGENKKYYHATLQDFAKIKRLLNGSWPSPLPQWSDNSPLKWPKYAAFDTEYYPDNNKLIRWSLCDIDYNLYCVESENTPYERIPIQQGSTVVIQNALADISHLANIVDFTQVNVEDMMLAHSVLWTGEPHSLNYIASLYGTFNRYKHLDHDLPQLYSALDAYVPMYMWRHHFIPEFKADQQSWKVYKKFRLPLIDIINKAQMSGSKVNTSRLAEVQRIFQDKVDQIKVRSKEVVGDEQFNIGGSKQLKEEIYGHI